MSTVISKGTVTKTETVGSGVVRNGVVASLKYKGTLASLTSGPGGLPSRGSKLTLAGASYIVTDVVVTPGKGGLAEGVVSLRPNTPGSSAGAGGLDAVFEVEMAQLEKPLLSHPRYKDVADIVRKWEGSPAAIRDQDKFEDADGSAADITDETALEAISKIRRGIESYLVFSPVVTKTSYPSSMPNNIGAACGKRQAPDVAASAAAAWLKTGDRVAQADGAFTRVEQWTGADEWDEDLYEEA